MRKLNAAAGLVAPQPQGEATAALTSAALGNLAEVGIAWQLVPDRRKVALRAGGVEHHLNVVTHTRPGMPDDETIARAFADGDPGLVTGRVISDRLSQTLRGRGLNHIDTAGNMSIRLPGLVAEVRGRGGHSRRSRPTTRSSGRRAGIKVLFGLLVDPDDAGRRSIRDVASAAGVSVGSAHGVLAELRDEGHLDASGLHRTASLLESWLAGYLNDRALRTPRLTFQHAPRWFDTPAVRETMREARAVLGGEDAAAAMGLPLRGTTGILYAPDPPTALVQAARLRRVDDGGLGWRRPFWRLDPSVPTAPSLLVYADLVASEDPRQSEIAAELRGTDALLRRLDAD